MKQKKQKEIETIEIDHTNWIKILGKFLLFFALFLLIVSVFGTVDDAINGKKRLENNKIDSLENMFNHCVQSCSEYKLKTGFTTNSIEISMTEMYKCQEQCVKLI